MLEWTLLIVLFLIAAGLAAAVTITSFRVLSEETSQSRPGVLIKCTLAVSMSFLVALVLLARLLFGL